MSEVLTDLVSSFVVRLALLTGLTFVAAPIPVTHAMKWDERPDAYGCRLQKNGKVDCPAIKGTFDFSSVFEPKKSLKPRVCKWKQSKPGGTYKCHYSKCPPEQWWCVEK
jgi:hypothetical protein